MAGVPYTEVAAGGHHFAVTAAQVEYRAPPPVLAIRCASRAFVQTCAAARCDFGYTVHNAANGTLLATGHTEHICVDMAGHMARIPQPLLERLRPVSSGWRRHGVN